VVDGTLALLSTMDDVGKPTARATSPTGAGEGTGGLGGVVAECNQAASPMENRDASSGSADVVAVAEGDWSGPVEQCETEDDRMSDGSTPTAGPRSSAKAGGGSGLSPQAPRPSNALREAAEMEA